MAARRTTPPRAAVALSTPPVDDRKVSRALAQIDQAVQELQAAPARDVLTFDLVVGSNHVRHSLGRAVKGYSLTPTVADATFAHALDTSNSRPDREVWISVIGAAQPGARIEVF